MVDEFARDMSRQFRCDCLVGIPTVAITLLIVHPNLALAAALLVLAASFPFAKAEMRAWGRRRNGMWRFKGWTRALSMVSLALLFAGLVLVLV